MVSAAFSTLCVTAPTYIYGGTNFTWIVKGESSGSPVPFAVKEFNAAL
jgi:hypothetical protein